jgi:hypothetical protein
MTPNADAMQEFLTRLFGNQLHGLIELAWRDADDGKLRHARLFYLDHLDDLVDLACEVNSVEGQNAYIGIAIRSPKTAPFARATDEDVICATAYWADLDVAEAVANARKRSGDTPANLAVITGRHPHPRAQLHWVQEDPITEMKALRAQNAAIAEALGGDPAVVNPGRLMRLAGSIAWPTKTGRIPEMTELQTWPDRPPQYVEGEVAKAFPVNAAKAETNKITGHKVSEIFGASAPDRWETLLRSGAVEGERNAQAAALAGWLFRHDIRPREALEIMRCINNSRFRPPLDDAEIVSVMESIAKAELKRRGKAA